jgi:hypothetical protein
MQASTQISFLKNILDEFFLTLVTKKKKRKDPVQTHTMDFCEKNA